MTIAAWLSTALLLAAPQDKSPKKKADAKPADRQERFSLSISGEVTPDFAPVVGRLTTLFYQSYPKLVERFEHPTKPAPRRIRMTFERGMKVPAYCAGSEIKISVEWLQKHPDDIGLLTHELTHAVQAYPRGDPGWLTEGIADYARQIYGPKEQPGWSLPKRLTEKNSYRESYRVAGRFFVWLDAKHHGAVDKVHRRMQDKEFTLGDFETAAGAPLDTLWDECVKDLSAEPSERKRAKAL
jgi:hypothetical protein